jgi:hypothetical protein
MKGKLFICVASLACVVLPMSAAASWIPNKNSAELSISQNGLATIALLDRQTTTNPAQGNVPRTDDISKERIKEKDEVQKRLGEVMRGAIDAALNGGAVPSISRYDQDFVDNLKKVVGALAARRLAQIALASRGNTIDRGRLQEVIAACD